MIGGNFLSLRIRVTLILLVPVTLSLIDWTLGLVTRLVASSSSIERVAI